jgi:gliding motility-associated-like protein
MRFFILFSFLFWSAFLSGQNLDVTIDSLMVSGVTCDGDIGSLCVRIKNNGPSDLDTFSIDSRVNGNPLFAPFTFIGDTLFSGEDTIICLGSTSLTSLDSLSAFVTIPGSFNELNYSNDSISTIISLKPNPIANARTDTTICGLNSLTLGGAPTSNAANSFQWTPVTFLNDPTVTNPVGFFNQGGTFTYIVIVTDSNLCTNTDSVTVEVYDIPTFNAGIDTIICMGGVAQLGGSPTAHSSSTVNWSNGTIVNNVLIQNPHATINDTEMFVLTVTDTNLCVFKDTMFAYTHPDPNLSAGANTTICYGDSIQLGAMPLANAIQSVYWSPGNFMLDSTQTNPFASPTASTTFTAHLIDTNQCSSESTVIISVKALPSASAGPDVEVCLNDTVQLGGSPTGPNGSSISWNTSFVDVATNPNPNFIANGLNPGVYSIVVYVTGSNGCTDSSNTNVTVFSLPTAVISPINSTICDGETLSLSASGGISYEWSPTNTLSNSIISNPGAFPSTSTLYTVTVTDANGCTDFESATLPVFPITPANAGLDKEVCQLESIELNATGGVNYNWSNGVFLSNANSANPDAFPLQTTTFTVTVTDANGCSKTDEMILTVHPLPIIKPGKNSAICRLDSIVLGGNPTSTLGVFFEWSPSASLNDANIANPTAAPTKATTYKVVVTTQVGCIDSATITISVDTLPEIYILNPILPICLDDTGLIEVTAGFKSYQWSPDLAIKGLNASSAKVFPKVNRTYSVTVTDFNNCSSDTSINIEVLSLPLAKAGIEKEICEGDSIELTASGGVLYFWKGDETIRDSAASSTIVSPMETTEYKVKVTDTNNCVNTDQVRIVVHPLPEADAGPDIEDCDINGVILGSSVLGNPDYIYRWTPETSLNDPLSPNPVLFDPERRSYQIEVQDKFGCRNIDSVNINADCYSVIHAPSAFTPGFNKNNDEFKISYYRINDPFLRIFDRWGELVFQTNDLDIGWDGSYPNDTKTAPFGVYYWILEYKTEDLKKQLKQGTVTLVN